MSGLINVFEDLSVSLDRSICHDYAELAYPTTKETTEPCGGAFNDKMELLPLITDFMNYLIRIRFSFKTVELYAKNLTYLVQYLTSENGSFQNSERDDCLLYVQRHEIQQYYTFLTSHQGDEVKKDITSRTIQNRDACYQHFFDKFLCEENTSDKISRPDNPYADGSLAKSPNTNLIRPALFEDVESLIKVSKHECEKSLLQFILDSGIRRAEVSTVKQMDILRLARQSRSSIIIDSQTIKVESEYHIFRIFGVKGKNREPKLRNTIISKATIDRIQKYHSSKKYRVFKKRYPHDQAPAFLNTKGNPYTPESISSLLTRLSNRAKKLGLLSEPISPHKLRHGFAVMLLHSPDLGESELDRLLVLQHCLGHNSLKITQDYTKIPIAVWRMFTDVSGDILTRAQLMERLSNKTRVRRA